MSPPLRWEEPADAWGALDACEREERGADLDDLVYPNYPESFRLEVLFLLDIEFQQQSIAGLGGERVHRHAGWEAFFTRQAVRRWRKPGAHSGSLS